MEKKPRKMQMSKCYPFRPAKKGDMVIQKRFTLKMSMEVLLFRQEHCLRAIANDEDIPSMPDPTGHLRKYTMHNEWNGYRLTRLLHQLSKEIYRRQLQALKGDYV